MPDLYRVDSGRLTLNMHEGQLRAWDSKRRFVCVLAGTQSGKTSWGPWWLHREIQATCDPTGLGQIPNDWIAATASYDLFKLKMLPTLREVFEHTLRMARWWSGDRILELRDPNTGKFWANDSSDRMWGRIVLRSAGSGGGLESLTARGAWGDEFGQDTCTLETWEAVLRRLSLYRGRVLLTTTPYNLGWMKRELYDKWEQGDKNVAVINFPSYMNPLFPMEEYERAKASMPLHRFLMFYQGLFAKPAGLIYDCFDDAIHLVRDFDIPKDWPRYVGIDFGAVNTALIWIAEDIGKGRFVVYRESLSGGKSTQEHVDEALALAKTENIVLWLGGAGSEDQQRMDWNTAGISVGQPYVSDVEGGIMRPYGLFKTKKLFVMESCRGLLDELGTYKRKLDENGQPTHEIENKRKFHRLDALRYVCTGLVDAGAVLGPNVWR
jgi:hypothetical protein